MKEIIIDALLDSMKVLLAVVLLNILLSFFEEKLSKLMNKNNKFSPFIASLVGLIPQCGVVVVGSDMYNKGRITRGTIVALFIACSDEALPILLSQKESAKYLLPLLIMKFFIAFIVGYFVDFIFNYSKHNQDDDSLHHVGCCHHEIEEESRLKKHLIHPLLHSLKIFLYVLGINILFGFIIYFIGEDSLVQLLGNTKYFSPLIATLIGLIPNCASSVVLCETFQLGAIGFGSVLAGLCCNAGLGLIYLFKNKLNLKDNLYIVLILVTTSLVVGYLVSFIVGF